MGVSVQGGLCLGGWKGGFCPTTVAEGTKPTGMHFSLGMLAHDLFVYWQSSDIHTLKLSVTGPHGPPNILEWIPLTTSSLATSTQL